MRIGVCRASSTAHLPNFRSTSHAIGFANTRLNALWSRGAWLSYFFILSFVTWAVYLTADLLHKVSKQRASFSPLPSPVMGRGSRPPPALNIFQRAMAKWRALESTVLAHMERLLQRTDDARVAWLEGIFYASCGGGLAGLCLVFTKAVVKIMWLPGHPVSLCRRRESESTARPKDCLCARPPSTPTPPLSLLVSLAALC